MLVFLFIVLAHQNPHSNPHLGQMFKTLGRSRGRVGIFQRVRALHAATASLHFYFNFERYAADQEAAGEVIVIKVGTVMHVFSGFPK